MLKSLLRSLLATLYRVEVAGAEHYRGVAGQRVLIVANHTSFLDAALLVAFLPDKLTFAINSDVAKHWWVKPFLRLVDAFPMNPASPYSTRSLIRLLQADRKVVIFPEGRITVTGSLMKIYDGTGMVADKSNALVLPVRIDGGQYTPFSRLRGRVRLRWFPQIRLTVLPARPLAVPAEVRGRARRQAAGSMLSDMMAEMVFATSNYQRTLIEALLDARFVHGLQHRVIEDLERKPLSYRQLLVRAFVLGRLISRQTYRGELVGLMLPNAAVTVLAFFGLHLFGRVPAMLNYTVGPAGLIAACRTGPIKTVYTSRRFVTAAKLEDAVERLGAAARVVYLEELRTELTLADKLMGAVFPRVARFLHRRLARGVTPESPAVVLFTSGSEGAPKGVVLSHANLLANREQVAARIAFSAQDIILNALPLFHSFGLTAGSLLPIFAGMRTFFYPSPLHYRIVPELAYDLNATVLFGTNTFLKGYARHAHPYDFYSTRYVFAGAEKLQDDTREIWADKFGIRVFEGYGATETAPVLTMNSPMQYRRGTVGRFLPGLEWRLVPVPGVEEGGRLEVRGPNVMLGHLLAERPGELVPPSTDAGPGWYDMGDIVSVDADGFVQIRGRAKRFAKIGGEMVSLAVVEELAAATWPGASHAVVAVSDAHKGEQLVLLTTREAPERGELSAEAKRAGLSELHVPRRIRTFKSLPLLGTGKIDYTAAQRLIDDEAA